MKYIQPILFAPFWDDVSKMIEENYANEYSENDCVIIGVCCFNNVNNIKNDFPYHDKYIAYQLEPLVKDHWHSLEKIISNLEGADEVWDYDLDNIKILNSYGIHAKFKPFIYSENLKRINNLENPDIDILFYGSLVKNRFEMLDKLSNHGITTENFVILCGVVGDKLDEYISRSKIILDLSTNEDRIQKQSRIYYALINDKCVVSEKSKINYFGDLILESEKDDLVTLLLKLLKEDTWKSFSENVSKKFKNMSVQDMINNYQKSIESDNWKNYSNVSEGFEKLIDNNIMDYNIIKPKQKNMLQKEDKLNILAEVPTAWSGHINFAEWLVKRKNAETIVDLGVDYGFSSFCFSIPEIGTVYGIDSFEGDPQTGIRNTYNFVCEKQNQLGINNLIFIRGFFEDILKIWTKPIDILHIDGFHTYEAVSCDYDNWSKFVKDDGVILFHDTCVDDSSFGVKRFYDELDLFKCNFTHSCGLGVVSKNPDIINEIRETFNLL
jgi:predicted O-methyltransferase YrrM